MGQINLTVLDQENKIIEIREGQALPLKEPLKIEIKGQIDSIFKFLEKRRTEIVEKSCHILVDSDKFLTILVIDESNYYSGSITGTLEHSKIFKDFGINSGVQKTTFQLADFIKMHRAYFENPSQASELVTVLKNFKAKVDREIESHENNRGNKRQLYNQVVDSNIPDSFNVELPIFKGLEKEKINLEVYINPETFECQLISPEAQEKIHLFTEGIINEQIEKITEICPDIVIINQ